MVKINLTQKITARKHGMRLRLLNILSILRMASLVGFPCSNDRMAGFDAVLMLWVRALMGASIWLRDNVFGGANFGKKLIVSACR